MKSLILTILYLIKDTIYRWKERPASPLARIFVSFFLSLCALSFLANYVLQTKLIQREIRQTGGDLIFVNEFSNANRINNHIFFSEILPQHYDCKVYSFKDSAIGPIQIKDKHVTAVEYDIATARHLSEELPLDAHSKILLTTKNSQAAIYEGPNEIEVANSRLSVYAHELPANHPLEKILYTGGLLLPLNSIDTPSDKRESWKYIIQVHDMTAKSIETITTAIGNYIKLDGGTPFVQSSLSILKKMDLLLGNQAESRAVFSLGIAFIVGILLTALASMEFRQNEYVYTLMKSFGVRPIFLIASFIAENIILVGTAFVGAIYAFLYTQKIVLGEFFKLSDAALTFEEIRNDMILLGSALLICVLISSIPIALSAYRPIGKVLK